MKKLYFLFLVLSLTASAQTGDKRLSILQFRKDLHRDFADPAKSPLLPSDLAEFTTLEYFPLDLSYNVIAKFERSVNEVPFPMKTTTAREPMYIKFGTLSFTLNGIACHLNVYQNVELIEKPGYEDYLFLPFSDLTSGVTSYIGGRYIDLRIPSGTTVEIDFNKAYNPYCAYNHKYSCPIVPLENDLPIAVNAGVMEFHD